MPAPPVRVLLIADVRSPITWGWADAVRAAGVVVLGMDGLPWPECRPPGTHGAGSRSGVSQRLKSFAVATPRRFKVADRVRRLAGPVLAPGKGWRIRRVVARARPDVVHGLRLPHEAMTALVACPPAVPLAVSVWGNDLTNEAPATRMGARATRRVLARADLLFADCQRDIDLAADWGLRPAAATAVLPGGGGIDLARAAQGHRDRARLPGVLEGDDYRLVLNARGVRAYVHNETLLAALSLLAPELDPLVRIVFVDCAHDVWLRRAIASHRLRDRMVVTGKRPPGEMLSLFRRAEVSVSITSRDGTPNTLLEAMASGAIPVCGDLPSIREWIEPGRNGYLAAFDDPRAVADALRCALRLSDAERSVISAENRRIVGARAERAAVGRQAAEKYALLAMRHEERLAPAGEP